MYPGLGETNLMLHWLLGDGDDGRDGDRISFGEGEEDDDDSDGGGNIEEKGGGQLTLIRLR